MSANYILKILTLGDTTVGKSSIVLRYAEDKFNENNALATIGIDFKIKQIYRGGELIKVSIYDTAGQERFQNIIKHYYRGANGVLLTYDITNRGSFEKLGFWLNDLKENSDSMEDLYICLIGNKIDNEDEREVTTEEANIYAKDNNMPYFEVSAKTGQGIKKLFDDVIKGAMIKMLNSTEKGDNARLSFLDKLDFKPKKKGCC